MNANMNNLLIIKMAILPDVLFVVFAIIPAFINWLMLKNKTVAIIPAKPKGVDTLDAISKIVSI